MLLDLRSNVRRMPTIDTQIALENVTRVNARMLLYFDTQ
jgi:hypothetical protein